MRTERRGQMMKEGKGKRGEISIVEGNGKGRHDKRRKRKMKEIDIMKERERGDMIKEGKGKWRKLI